MFPWSHVCKNNNWPGLWMAESTIRLVLNKAWLEWPPGPFSDLSQLPEFIHSLNRYFWGPTTNQAIHNINVRNRWQTRATHSFGKIVQHPQGHYVCRISYAKTLSCGCFCSAVQSFSHFWLCDPMDCSMPGFPVLHHLLELAQIHVHWVGDAIQPSRPLSSPSPPAFNISQHQGFILNPMNSMKNTQWFDTNLLRGTELCGNTTQWNMHMVWLPSRISNPMMLYALIQKHLCLQET